MTLLPMEDKSSILCALRSEFEKLKFIFPGFQKDKSAGIPQVLEDYIRQIAMNGKTLKLHTEDPRFPSRAGLDECNLLMNDALLSPPSSPSIDSFMLHQTSKSSDDDEPTSDEHDEELEDADDMNGESSEDQVSNSSGSTDQMDVSSANDHTSDLNMLPRLSPVTHKSTAITTECDSVQSSSIDHTIYQSHPESSMDPQLIETMESDEVTSSDAGEGNTCMEEDNSERQESTELTPENRKILVVKEPVRDPVPPISEVFRPSTDRLEALVDNMTPHNASPTAEFVQLPDRDSPTPDSKCQEMPTDDASDAIGSTNSESQSAPDNTSTDPSQERMPSVSPAKRQAPSDIDKDDAISNVALNNEAGGVEPELSESPAKRRRLEDSFGAEEITRSETSSGYSSTSGGPQDNLNASPPVIVCAAPDSSKVVLSCSDLLPTDTDFEDADETKRAEDGVDQKSAD